jgi:endonuclease III
MSRRLKLPEVLAVLEKAYGKPRTAEHPEAPLLDHLLVGVLSAWADREKAARSVRALSETFVDLNEARVSPLAELSHVLAPWLGAKAGEAAEAVRLALQDVYDGTHGLDLEPLRGRDPEDLRKFLKDLPHTAGGPATSVFQLALGADRLALMAPETRVLERLRLLPTSAVPQKVRQALERQVKPEDRLAFAWSLGSHAQEVCLAKDPRCEGCPLLEGCPFGAAEVKRLAAERKKEEQRRVEEERRRKIEEAAAAREAARREAAEAKRRAVEEAKARRVAEAKAKAEQKVREAAAARAEVARKKAEAVAAKKAEAARKKAEAEAAKKAAVARKKAEAAAAKKAEAARKKAEALARKKAEAEARKKAAAAKAKAKKTGKK